MTLTPTPYTAASFARHAAEADAPAVSQPAPPGSLPPVPVPLFTPPPAPTATPPQNAAPTPAPPPSVAPAPLPQPPAAPQAAPPQAPPATPPVNAPGIPTPGLDDEFVPPEPPKKWYEPFETAFEGLGDWTLFSQRAVSGVFSSHLKLNELVRVGVDVGVSSVGVVALTGFFIGMVLAVQAYSQFHLIGLDTSLGAVIHMSVVRELGPVLAAVMLAGRVGTAMAAQLGTMRVTEQIDALACLGVDPVKYLVGPRFLGCLLVIPLLSVIADALGIVGSTLICLKVFHIDGFHYWRHTANFVKPWDLFVGLGKSVLFGGVLSLICCHRGFRSRAGAEGVGRAATEGFVLSFIAILVLDFVLAMFTNALANLIWPKATMGVA